MVLSAETPFFSQTRHRPPFHGCASSIDQLPRGVRCLGFQFEGENQLFRIDRDRLGASSDMLLGEGPEQTPFNSSDQPSRQIDCDTLESPAAVRSFLDSLLRRGYGRIRGVRADDASLFNVLKRLGFTGSQSQLMIEREVIHHGGIEGSAHLLASHTEAPHRDPIPDYHIRLCVETTLKGGDMILVDGLNAVTTLAMESPIAAAELSRWPMLFVGNRSGSERRLVPMLETGVDGSLQDHLQRPGLDRLRLPRRPSRSVRRGL